MLTLDAKLQWVALPGSPSDMLQCVTHGVTCLLGQQQATVLYWLHYGPNWPAMVNAATLHYNTLHYRQRGGSPLDPACMPA
jgi:hypothetical protein